MRRALHQGRREVVIVQRTRLGRSLVAVALALGVASGLLLVGIGVVSSPALASDAAADLLAVPEIAEPIEDVLASDLVRSAPDGTLTPEVAPAVAARMVRDSAVVADIARAAADAQRQWRQDEQPVLVLRADVLTPAALTALRDVDLELSRSIGEDLEVVPSPIALPMTVDRAENVEEVRGIATTGLVVAAVLFVIGAVLDPRRDRTIRATSTALLVFGAVLAVAPFLAGLPDLSGASWGTASILAMTHAGMVPLLIGGVGSLLLGAFLRAVAGQAQPIVEARIAARERAAIEPPPVSTGTQPPRRSGRAVRQEAIDAFFAPGEERDGDAGRADDDLIPSVEDAPATTAPATTVAAATGAATPRDGRPAPDEFARVLDAVDSEPHGTAEPEPDGATDEGEAEDSTAEAVATERRESLERIDGNRSPLRTHLPR